MTATLERPVRLGTVDEGEQLETWRCHACKRIVAKHIGLSGTVEIKCKCGAMNVLMVVREQSRAA